MILSGGTLFGLAESSNEGVEETYQAVIESGLEALEED